MGDGFGRTSISQSRVVADCRSDIYRSRDYMIYLVFYFLFIPSLQGTVLHETCHPVSGIVALKSVRLRCTNTWVW